MPSEEVIGVAELDRRLKRAVEGVTGREWVQGEVASLKLASSGHAYFTLKDEREDAVIDCVMYRMNALRALRHLSEGARVQVLGRATLWAPRGRLQLVAERLRLEGRGALLEALEALKARLSAEGLFALEKKRPLPSEPRVVGVVTSSAGAAFHDIRTVAFRRGAARLVLSAALVQGEGAAESIVAAIDRLERYPGLDVMIVGRGGGSAEDLMAFNDERVVRRIAAATVPVVSAVGHEVDITLSDLAADVRAATPSQAAELVIPDREARAEALARQRRHLLHAVRSRLVAARAQVSRLRAELSDPRFLIAERQQGIDELAQRLERSMRRHASERRAALERAHRRLSERHPRAVLSLSRSVLGPLSARLEAAIRSDTTRRRASLGRASAKLEALSPLAVLARGYAIALAKDGRAIRGITEVSVGDRVEVLLSEGRLAARVTELLRPPEEE
ncbi:MAG: exodeoxyribonuclease VII large subunit [Polyangiaceae bacterium]